MLIILVFREADGEVGDIIVSRKIEILLEGVRGRVLLFALVVLARESLAFFFVVVTSNVVVKVIFRLNDSSRNGSGSFSPLRRLVLLAALCVSLG